MPTLTPTPRQHARTETERLVTNFQHQLAGHKLVSFNETQTRRDFLDPWLAALGWDTENRRKLPQPLREVHMEARVLVAGRVKFPDYEFRLDGQSRFFLEAKKPSVNLHDDWKPANQVRLYSWSAKLPVGVLTDFEELAIYDCRQQPAYQDLPSVGRLRYLTYDQYLDQFDTLYDLLGREAVAAGSLHALAATLPQQRGTQSVDKAFLTTLEHMREQLATALARHNRQLTAPELRFLVQALLDRIIFLRMAEDRGLEPYENLQRVLDSARLHGPDAPYQALIGRFREAQNRYNSGLFDLKADTLSAKVKLPETVLRPLLENLYYPRSPYQFAVMGADILGAAYERFLGKVIELPEPGRVVIEDKPAVRKAGGVYYTPDYIVRYLVQQALEPLCAGRTPAEVAELRIVDPACGSGSFLLGAYDFLLEWHLRYYQANPKAASAYNPPATPRQPPGNPPATPRQPPVLQKGRVRNPPALTPDGRLTTAVRKAILLNNLFGVDLDEQAVEVAKLSLLMRCMEGESSASATQAQLGLERLLPTLDDNVRCGNSLVDERLFSAAGYREGDEQGLAPFEWRAEFAAVFAKGGFDAVIGNPPYIRIQVLREMSSAQADFITTHYKTARDGNYDIYVPFIERALELLNPQGRAAYILPHKFLNAKYGQAARELLSETRAVERIVHFGDQQVFDGISTYTCLLLLTRAPQDVVEVEAVTDLNAWRTRTTAPIWVTVPYARLGGTEWNLATPAAADLLARLRATSHTLADATTRIFQGLKTSADKIYIVEEIERRDGKIRVLCRHDNTEHWLESTLLHPLVKGGDSRRYRLTPTSRLILFPYGPNESGKSELLVSSVLQQHYPLTLKYFRHHEQYLRSREQSKFDNAGWYAYGRSQALDVISRPKLFTPDIAAKAAFSYDPKGDVFFTGGAAGGYGLVPAEGVEPAYLLGILNSQLFEWMVRQTSTQMRGGYFSFESRFIAPLPVPKPIPSTRAAHEAVAAQATLLLTLHPQLAAATVPSQQRVLATRVRQVENTLNELVFDLYGVSKVEQAIVKESLE